MAKHSTAGTMTYLLDIAGRKIILKLAYTFVVSPSRF